MLRDVSSNTKIEMVCRGNFYSGFSVCFLVPVWSSCSFHWKTESELRPPHINGLSVIYNWKENFCSQQAGWSKAFTDTYITEWRSMWGDIHSSRTKGNVSKRNFYSVLCVCFLGSVWSYCSFHCKPELKLEPPHLYLCSVVSTEKSFVFPSS